MYFLLIVYRKHIFVVVTLLLPCFLHLHVMWVGRGYLSSLRSQSEVTRTNLYLLTSILKQI